MIPLADRLLRLEMWRVNALPASHPVFDAPRAAYPDFKAWLGRVQLRRMYVVTANGIAVGVAIVKREDRHLKLCCLSVMPCHEGHGVGAMLMRQFLADAEDFELSPYFTSKVDAPVKVRRFARKHGFDAIGHIGGDHHWVLHDGEPLWIAPRD